MAVVVHIITLNPLFLGKNLFSLNIDMSVCDYVWDRARVDWRSTGLKLLVIAALYWHVWKERNNRIFKNSAH